MKNTKSIPLTTSNILVGILLVALIGLIFWIAQQGSAIQRLLRLQSEDTPTPASPSTPATPAPAPRIENDEGMVIIEQDGNTQSGLSFNCLNIQELLPDATAYPGEPINGEYVQAFQTITGYTHEVRTTEGGRMSDAALAALAFFKAVNVSPSANALQVLESPLREWIWYRGSSTPRNTSRGELRCNTIMGEGIRNFISRLRIR